MARIRRDLRSPETIRKTIEDGGIKYVMINNRIFDDFYEKGTITQTKSGKEFTVTFNELELILFIFLKFLDKYDFQGYEDEIAQYIGYSTKQVKTALKRLQLLRGEMNNRFIQKDQAREIIEDGEPLHKEPLVKEKIVNGYVNNKLTPMKRWHVDYDCDYKKEVNEDTGEILYVPTNFFTVTIYDLDLFTKKILSKGEFIMYLFFIRKYKSGFDPVWFKTSTIAESLRIKLHGTAQKYIDRIVNLRIKDIYCEENQDFPLVHTRKPKNFNDKLTNNHEPSIGYIPIYNEQMMKRLNNNMETDLNN